MRLKYYLRGVGIGIIFATLVMTVSSLVHKYNISDEYIMKEARKLGMVMKDELKNDNGFWSSDETEEDSSDESENTQGSQTTEDSQSTEDTQVAASEVEPSESESESQAPVEPETPVEPEIPVEPETPVESESESEEVEYVTVVIVSGDYARQVAEKVCAAGLVEDAEDFRKYIGSQGYGQSMHPGTYYIPVGSDYEEICQILLVRQR